MGWCTSRTPRRFLSDSSFIVIGGCESFLVLEYRVDGNNWRLWEYSGYLQGLKVALFWGNRIDLARSDRLRQRLKNLMENKIVLDFYDFSEKRLMEYAHYIKQFRPSIIRVYAGSIYLFVE